MADVAKIIGHEALWFAPTSDGLRPLVDALWTERLQRAIGVIYRPESERLSHYFTARLPEQFDAVMHIDRTSALRPLETWARDEVDMPETYPWGV